MERWGLMIYRLSCHVGTAKKGSTQAARKMASTALRATQGHHHPLWIWTAEYFAEFWGTDCSENVAMYIFSRCEGDMPPTSATQYIFVMLYGTFVSCKSDLPHWWLAPMQLASCLTLEHMVSSKVCRINGPCLLIDLLSVGKVKVSAGSGGAKETLDVHSHLWESWDIGAVGHKSSPPYPWLPGQNEKGFEDVQLWIPKVWDLAWNLKWRDQWKEEIDWASTEYLSLLWALLSLWNLKYYFVYRSGKWGWENNFSLVK